MERTIMKKLKLISALGNKDLILELIDFFNGGDRYAYNDAATGIRCRFGGCKLDAIHLVCTREALEKTLPELQALLSTEYPAVQVHPIKLPCRDIACDHDDETMRQLVYDTVRTLAPDNLIIASGGRKTLTNRLIEAGLLYGCMGYLTITAPPGKENEANIRQQTKKFNVLWIPARRFFEERREGLTKDKIGDNFRSLYLLPLTMIDRLRREKVGQDTASAAADLAWLQRLPKADLHCHLGGAFDAALLKEMAAALLDDLEVTAAARATIRETLSQRLGCPLSETSPEDLLSLAAANENIHCLNGLKDLGKDATAPEHIRTALLVEALTLERIEAICRHEPTGLAHKDRLQWYMACGDLGGSSLLQTEGNLRRTLRWLMEQAWQEQVLFLEVRFSPDNYTRAGLTIRQVIDTLMDEGGRFMASHQGFRVNFLIMATRHKDRASMIAHVAAAVTFNQSPPAVGPRLTGFDLAGQEEGNDPALFQEIFMPLHHHFVNITIHAGEMAEDDKIWQALYLLHAKRIGHGLKLVNNTRMMDFVRDYGIAIEMCPSSNSQTNAFRRFDLPDQEGVAYPLLRYLDHGISVTINTDNRGHSATTLANEYLQAARLTEGGLSKWEVLRLVKNGFKAAFLPKNEKDHLLKEMDKTIFELILDDFFPREAGYNGD